MRIAIIAVAGSLALTACTDGTAPAGANTAGGAVLGAVAGGALGAAVGGRQGAVIGAAAGAVVGGAIGARLDAESEARRQAALNELAQQAQRARDANAVRPVSWNGPAEKNTSGQIRVRSRPAVVQGRTCMAVTETVTINGQPQQVDETRCRGADGRWA